MEKGEQGTLLDDEGRGGEWEKLGEEEEEEMEEEFEILFVISRRALQVLLFLRMICMMKMLFIVVNIILF